MPLTIAPESAKVIGRTNPEAIRDLEKFLLKLTAKVRTQSEILRQTLFSKSPEYDERTANEQWGELRVRIEPSGSGLKTSAQLTSNELEIRNKWEAGILKTLLGDNPPYMTSSEIMPGRKIRISAKYGPTKNPCQILDDVLCCLKVMPCISKSYQFSQEHGSIRVKK